jgi:predicted membrane-bound mannosyltransferase
VSAAQQVAVAVLGVIAYLGLAVALAVAVGLTVRARDRQVPRDQTPAVETAAARPPATVEDRRGVHLDRLL